MTRKYIVSKYVGRPLKYSTRDLKEMINKVHSDKYFSEKFNITESLIHCMRSCASKRFKIPIKYKYRKQKYNNKLLNFKR